MTNHDLLSIIEEGLKNGRISPHLAAYIAGEVLDTEAHDTGYIEWVHTTSADDALTEVAEAVLV